MKNLLVRIIILLLLVINGSVVAMDKADLANQKALMIQAMWEKNADAVRRLIQEGAEVNSKTWSPLLQAVALDAQAIVEELLAAGANPNIRNELGQSALWVAVSYKHYEIAQMLINAGAYVDTPDKQYGMTPLMRAVTDNNIPMIQMLMDAFADTTIKNHWGKTALDIAREMNAPADFLNLLSRKPQKAK